MDGHAYWETSGSKFIRNGTSLNNKPHTEMTKSGRVTPAVLGQAHPWLNDYNISNLFDPFFYYWNKCLVKLAFGG